MAGKETRNNEVQFGLVFMAEWISALDGYLMPNPAIFIFTNPSARAGYDTRSIFKRSLTGLNSEFSF